MQAPRKKDVGLTVKTRAVFFPFDLFGSAGTGGGADLLADAFQEMLEDNRRERIPTQARSYQNRVRMRRLSFETLADYQDWRMKARQLVQQAFRKGEFLLWITGNHLGVMPVYDELAADKTTRSPDTVVLQFDAHLDAYNLSDCTAELSHGNFLLHCRRPLPHIINVGNRELLLRSEHVRKYYAEVFPASGLAIDPEPIVEKIRKVSQEFARVFLDIDCDVFDPAYFPAVTHPLPFGLSPSLLLRLLDAAWSERVVGVAISEFDPGRDRNDRSLSVLIWLLEYLMLKKYEKRD
jgi:arginase family enzyme